MFYYLQKILQKLSQSGQLLLTLYAIKQYLIPKIKCCNLCHSLIKADNDYQKET